VRLISLRPPEELMRTISTKHALRVLLVSALSLSVSGCIAISKDAYDRDMSAMKGQQELLENQKNTLAKELQQCRSKAKTQVEALGRCRSQADDLKAQLDECRDKLKRIAKSCGRSGVLLSQCEQQLAIERGRVSSLKAENLRLKARAEAIEAQLNALKASFIKLKEELAGLLSSGKLRLVVKEGLLVIQMQSDVLFDTGRSNLKAQAKPVLRDLARVLKGFEGRRFQVAGHTDPSGGGDINWPLSTQRALSVVNFLIKSARMPAKMLSAGGYASYLPTAPNTTESNRALNRRVEFVLMPDLGKLLELSGLTETP